MRSFLFILSFDKGLSTNKQVIILVQNGRQNEKADKRKCLSALAISRNYFGDNFIFMVDNVHASGIKAVKKSVVKY